MVIINVLKIVNWFRVTNSADLKKYEFSEELTQMKVMKLLYYVQGLYLKLYDKRAFDNDILAWRWGPAIQEVHDKYIGQREIVGEISEQDLADFKEVNSDERLAEIVEAVNEAMGNMSASDLVRKTHEERPWKETEQSDVIADDLIKDFFDKNFKVSRE